MNRRKNIMLLIPTLSYGGSQRAACGISRLIQNEHQVYLVTFNGSDNAFPYGGTLVDLKLPAAKTKIGKVCRYIRRTFTIKQEVHKLRIDVVIGFTGVANQYVSILGQKCLKFISSRGYEDLVKNETLIARQTEKCDGVIFNAEDSKQYFAKRHPALAAKCVSIPNCFDLEQLRRDAQDNTDEVFRNSCTGKQVIIAVGRLCQVKGFDGLIKSFFLLQKRLENVRLAIIGDGEEMDTLRQLAADSPDILLMGARKNPMPYLAAADAFVLSSRHEGFPNVVIEAMSVGVPVICTNCRSGPNEILNKTYEMNRQISKVTLCDYGILVPPMDEANTNTQERDSTNECSDRLADAMEMLLKDKALIARYRAASFNRAADFSFEASKDKYLALINKIINKNG